MKNDYSTRYNILKFIRVNVTEEDEEEIVESLLEYWINNKKDGEIFYIISLRNIIA